MYKELEEFCPGITQQKSSTQQFWLNDEKRAKFSQSFAQSLEQIEGELSEDGKKMINLNNLPFETPSSGIFNNKLPMTCEGIYLSSDLFPKNIIRTKINNICFCLISFDYGKFSDVIFNNCTFDSCKFNFTDFSNCHFQDCYFYISDFTGNHISSCTFYDCAFSILKNLQNLKIQYSTFENCRYHIGNPIFEDCYIDNRSRFSILKTEKPKRKMDIPKHKDLFENGKQIFTSHFYENIKNGYLASSSYEIARAYYFKQEQAYTKYNITVHRSEYQQIISLLEKLSKYKQIILALEKLFKTKNIPAKFENSIKFLYKLIKTDYGIRKLIEITTGYGTDPMKSVRAIILSFLLFTIVLGCFGLKIEIYNKQRFLNVPELLLLSSGAFLTFGNILPGAVLMSGFAKIIFTIESFTGIILNGLFLTTLSSYWSFGKNR